MTTLSAAGKTKKHMAEFWTWYISLFSDADNKVVVATWSATIATVGFLINYLLIPVWKLFKKQPTKEKSAETQGSVNITSINQSGGQTAHTITNRNKKHN